MLKSPVSSTSIFPDSTVDTFCYEQGIFMPEDLKLQKQWDEILQKFSAASRALPHVLNHPLLQIPGLTLADLIFVYNRQLSGSYYQLAAGKSRNVLFLAAYQLKVEDLKLLLREFKDKQCLIPELEEQLRNPKSNHAELQLKINQIKAVAPDLTGKDVYGRHIVHFAAISGQYENLVFLLEYPGVIASLTPDDKRLLMSCAIQSRSIECMRYVTGTVGISPGMSPQTLVDSTEQAQVFPYLLDTKGFIPFTDKEQEEIKRMPVLTRAEIENKFAKADDLALYEFLKQLQLNKKKYTVILAYYYMGGKPEKCVEMLHRVRKLELSPLMQDLNYDIGIVIDIQREFSGYTWSLAEFKKLQLEEFPHYYAMSAFDASRAYLNALKNGAVVETHALLHRYRNIIDLSMIKDVLLPATREGKKQFLVGLLQKKMLTLGALQEPALGLLPEAAKYGQLEMVRYFIEELHIPVNSTLAHATGQITSNAEVVDYLLNRADFLVFDEKNLKWDLELSTNAKYQLENFSFSESGVTKLFAKPNQELFAYLEFMAKLHRGGEPAGLNPLKLSIAVKLRVIRKLLELERESIALHVCPEFFITAQVRLSATLLASTHLSEEEKRELAIYQSELESHYAACLATVANPFNSELQRARCVTLLEDSKKFARFGALEPLQKANQLEAMRFAHLVDQQQGDVVNHLKKLQELAVLGCVDAVNYLNQYHDKLSLSLSQAARGEKGETAETQLRTLAKTHPFAQLQLAIVLIQRYESHSFKLFKQAQAKEAFAMISDPRITHYPDTTYYRGRCLQEGIGCAPSIHQALHQYYLAAINHSDLAKMMLKQWSQQSSRTSDAACIAAIYRCLIAGLDNTRGYYLAFLDEAQNFPDIFSKCMLSVAEQCDAPNIKILLWQEALKTATVEKDKQMLEKCLLTYLMQLNQNSEKEIYQFTQAVLALDVEVCAKYAIRFVEDGKLTEEIRRLWIVAAELMWTNGYGHASSSPTLTKLRNYLGHISQNDQHRLRASLHVGTLITETKSKVVEPIPEPVSAENAVVVVARDNFPLQNRLEACDFTGKIPAHLVDPIYHHIMSDPVVCEDERIYDRSTYESLINKSSPFNSNVTIVRGKCMPVAEIRCAALEFVETLERAKKVMTASSSSSSTSVSAASQAGITFYTPAPTAPAEERVMITPPSAPVQGNDDDDEVTYPVIPSVIPAIAAEVSTQVVQPAPQFA